MSAFINMSRSKRGSTATRSSSPSLGRDSVASRADASSTYFFRIRSIRSTMTPDKLLQCFRDDYRRRVNLRPLVPNPLSEPQTIPELSAVASLRVADGEHVGSAQLSSVVLIDDDFTGFTNLHEPSDPAAVDVIAIPAVDSHPFRTWTTFTRNGPEMWLQDFLPPNVPQARVLVYGHDLSNVENESDAVSALAAAFAADLTAMRHKTRINQRPLALIAHSTGCLIVKKALCELPDLVEQELIKRVVFLGAPHDGLHHSAVKMLLDADRTGSLPRELSAGSQSVLDLNSAFAPVADRLHIVAFYETLKTASNSRDSSPSARSTSSSVLVVPSESATLFRSTERAVECDHYELARASAGGGVLYADILAELQGVVNDVVRPAGWKVQQRGAAASPTSQGSQTDYFAESPTATIRSWPKSYDAAPTATPPPPPPPPPPQPKSRTKSIPTPFRRRSSTTASVAPQLALHHAVRANDMDEARRLLETFTELDAKDPARDNRTALHEAAAAGNAEVAKALLAAGAAVEPRTRASFRTPLHYAAREGHEELVRLLLDRAARINSRSGDQSTPLHLAAEKGHRHVVRALLGRDASVHIERDRGVTALELAERYQHDEIARLLRNRGATVNHNKPSLAPEYPGLF